jgi:hypothetical protein
MYSSTPLLLCFAKAAFSLCRSVFFIVMQPLARSSKRKCGAEHLVEEQKKRARPSKAQGKQAPPLQEIWAAALTNEKVRSLGLVD